MTAKFSCAEGGQERNKIANFDPMTGTAHHIVNAGAVAAPTTIAALTHFPPLESIVAIVMGFVGLCWYGVLFHDRFFGGPKKPD